MKNKTLYLSDYFVELYELETNEIHFSVIEEVIDFCEDKELKIAPRVSRRKCIDVGTAQYGKMNVEPAAAMLSFEMAAAIDHVVTYHNKPRSWLTTGNFCAMVGRWYEVCNNRKRSMSFDSGNMTKTRENIEFITLFMEYFATLKLFQTQKKIYPCQKGVCLTTKSILWLQEMLLSNGVTFFLSSRVSGDSVENYHSQVRQLNPNPTLIEYERFQKVLGVTHVMTKNVKGSSYDFDETDDWLSDFKSIKQLQDSSVKDDLQDKIMHDARNYYELDFEDLASLASLSGYILHHTIRTSSRCATCMDKFCQKVDDEPQGANTLIDSRDITTFGLVRPTKLANSIFVEAESVFINAREDLKNESKFEDKIVTLIINYLEKEIESSYPTCHLKIIIRRFVKCRSHFWAKYRDDQAKTEHRADIDQAAASSRTAEQMNSVQ